MKPIKNILLLAIGEKNIGTGLGASAVDTGISIITFCKSLLFAWYTLIIAYPESSNA